MSKPPYRVPLMSEIKNKPWNGFNVISTFSGCGGSSLGYKMAGYKVLWASEFIPAAQETYRANHPDTILDTRDIREVQARDILKAIKMKVGELDLFDGSPPCASFSTAGIGKDGWGRVKKYSDTEQRTDDLFFEYARLVRDLQPKVFIAENVKGLTQGDGKEMLGDFQMDMLKSQDDTILHTLIDCGYRVGFRVLNAADLGVPQSRNRVIFCGVRRDLAEGFNLEPFWPKKLGYQYSVRDAIPWMVSTENLTGFNGHEQIKANKLMPAILTSRPVSCVVEKECDITNYAIGREYDNIKVGEQSEKYFSLVRPSPDRPCPCVTQTAGNTSAAGVCHPFEKRKFSIAELKRICAFPDDFILTGKYAQQWERLGRAVPPVMMMHIANCVRQNILKKIL